MTTKPAPRLKRTIRYHSRDQEVREVEFDVSADYVLEDVIGEGAYGVVCGARHVPSGVRVAIKKIHPFERPLFCMRTLREIKLLRHFDNENIVGILDIDCPEDEEELKDVYIVQERMETDLSRVIRSQRLTDDHVQYFMYQILRALKAVHSAKVLHRDLKPGNLLINGNCDLKLCDFGLARSVLPHGGDPSDQQANFMTEYVATRWYRAPEIMLTYQHYTFAIDMWAAGCILAEMLGGLPLFPGKDYCDQLNLILEVLGSPTPEDCCNIRSRRAREYVLGLPHFSKRSFHEIYPEANPWAIDLLERLLVFNPENRLTVEEALQHPYISNYHEPADEPGAPELPRNFFDFENTSAPLTSDQMRHLVHHEILNSGAPLRGFYR